MKTDTELLVTQKLQFGIARSSSSITIQDKMYFFGGIVWQDNAFVAGSHLKTYELDLHTRILKEADEQIPFVARQVKTVVHYTVDKIVDHSK